MEKHLGQNQALATILDLGQVLLGIQENLVLLLEKKLELAYLELEV